MFRFSVTVLFIFCISTIQAATPTRSDLKDWGTSTLGTIQRDFELKNRPGYFADEIKTSRPNEGGPVFMWGAGVQLAALAEAARHDSPKWKDPLKRYSDMLLTYWNTGNGTEGYDVLPIPKPLDRYYDDNEWVVLGLLDANEATKDPVYLERAEKTMQFVLSGEDNKLGGGIYWKETELASKNTCSNAPAIAGALRLYQATRKRAYLETAKRLYAWVNVNLQDIDGLYFDNIKLNGEIEKTKWCYNSALMIRSNVLMYRVTKDRKYLVEAQRIANAAEEKWIDKDTGAIKQGSQFAYLLCEDFIYLYEQSKNKRYLNDTLRALDFVHAKCLTSNGYYSQEWDKPVSEPLQKVRLIDMASAARAFLVAATAVKK